MLIIALRRVLALFVIPTSTRDSLPISNTALNYPPSVVSVAQGLQGLPGRPGGGAVDWDQSLVGSLACLEPG